MPSSRESVLALRAQGYKDAEIAQTLSGQGRSFGASYVSKIATGKKPARNLEGALSELAGQGSAPVAGAPRRQTTGGEEARVRQGRVRTGTGFIAEVSSPQGIRRALRDAASRGLSLKITIHARRVKAYRGFTRSPGKVEFGKGVKAAGMLQTLDSIGGDIREGLITLAFEYQEGNLEELQGFLYAEIQAGDWQDVSRGSR